MTDFATERLRDGAFFEDWSPWKVLGGHLWERHGRYHLRSGQASYHCILMQRLPYDGRPGFEVTVPGRIAIANLLRRIPGAYEPKIAKGPRGLFDRWYVPAESWRELRTALPTISDITEKLYGAAP